MKTTFKKPWLQAMMESLPDEQLTAFTKFLKKPDRAAIVMCLKEAAKNAKEAREPKKKAVKASRKQSDEERIFDYFTKLQWNKKLAEIRMVSRSKNAVQNLDNEAFVSALNARFGVNELFGDEAMRAVTKGDAGFFTAAAESIKAVSSNSKIGKENRRLAHLTVALIILKQSRITLKNRKIEKQSMRAKIETMLGKMNIIPFSDEGSWQALWNRPELKPFLKNAHLGRAGCGYGNTPETY